MSAPDAFAAGMDVLVTYPEMFDRVLIGRVEAYVGVTPDGLHVYRVNLPGGYWVQVPVWSLTDVTALATRPRAAFSPVAGHA